MKTLRVCVVFLICAIASSVTSPPIVKSSGYFYNLNPRKQTEGASRRVFGLHDLKYLVAKPDTPVYIKVAYFVTLACIIIGIFIFCLPPLFYFFKKLVNRICIGAPEPQRPPDLIMQLM